MCAREIVIEVGKSYITSSEKFLYSVAEKIASSGYSVLYLTRRNPEQVIEDFRWVKNEEGYWLTTSPTESHKTLEPTRLEFEISQTIMEFIKTHKKSVIVIDAISLLMAENGFEKLFEFVKGMANFVSLHNSVFLAYAPLKIFKEKEKALLMEYLTEIIPINEEVAVKLLVKCDKCGKRVEDKVIYCPACGNPVIKLSAEKEKLEILEEIVKEVLEEEAKGRTVSRRDIKPLEEKRKETHGLVNGTKIQRRVQKVRKGEKKHMVLGVFACALILSSIFLVLYAFQSPAKIKIDGNLEDWLGIARYTDDLQVANQDINLSEYSVYYESEKVYFYAKVSGNLFNGIHNGYDSLLIFVDTDGNLETGYKIECLGADAKIEVSGYDGEIRSASVSRFIEDTFSTKPELNYSAWENAGEVRVEKRENVVEGYARIGGLANPVSLVVMRHYEGNGYAEKRGMALVGKTEGSLVIYQNFIGNDVVNADADVLELRLVAKGNGVHVEAVSLENATVDLPKKDLGVDEELTVRCRAKSLSEGVAYGFAVSGVNTNVPCRIVGSGGKAYFGSLPSGIVIDGAFGDWQGVQKGSDASGDAGQNIDLREYASAIASNAYFYMAVDGTMLAGCEIPVLGARPQQGPVGPVVLKENLGLDVARVYIELLNSTINTFNPAMIQHGYLIELQGRNGEVISAKAWKWENGVRAEEIQNPGIAHGLSNGRIEFSVGLDKLPGIDPNSKFYFEMSNWLGEKDASEVAYFVGREGVRVGGDGSYGSSLLTEFTGSYNKVVLVNDRYTSTTKGALRLENNTVAYGGLNATDVDANGNLTVSNTRYWNGTYYFRHLKIAST
ncbi:MAG: DUF835 domain-containing protein, partial [Thermoplasmata archaeon]